MRELPFPAHLGTPQVADACTRLGIVARCGPGSIRPLGNDMRCAGRVLPLSYDGAPERFFEVLDHALPGDVFVLDNEGRLDDACMGDVMACELRNAGLSGLVIWGTHRDSETLARMGWPIFSLGTYPCAGTGGGSRTRSSVARCGDTAVSSNDFVVCDCDGIVFFDAKEQSRVVDAGNAVANREAMLISSIANGFSLRRQLEYDEFVKCRKSDPSLRFGDHIKKVSGGS